MRVTPVKNAQDPRVKRTRQLLQDAFVSLLGEKDFQTVTVQDIAERATVNRATFYAHYLDKYDLADRLAREQFQQRLAASVPSVSPLTASTLESLSITVFDFLAEVYGDCYLDRQFGSVLEGAMHDELSAFVVHWLNQSVPDDAARRSAIEAVALTVSSALIGAGLRWSRHERKQPARELADQVVAVLAPGELAAYQG